jgi:hypothetical protein
MFRRVRFLLALPALLVLAPRATPADNPALPAETADLAQYLHEFDRHAHASAAELKGELATPVLMARSGYGGPAETRSLTREALDQSLKDPLPARFRLQRAQILSAGAVPAANLVYQVVDEGREIDLGLLLARAGNGYKVAAMIIAPPYPDTSRVDKFLKAAEEAVHATGSPSLDLFLAPVHRIATRGAGEAAQPDLEALGQDQAATLLGLPLPPRARLLKSVVLASYLDSAIAELQFKNGGTLTRALVLILRPEAGWRISAIARE